MLVPVGSQDKALRTPSRYLARTISWIPCKVLLLYYYQLYCPQQMLTRTQPLLVMPSHHYYFYYHHSPIVGDARGDLRHAVKGAKDKTPALVGWRHSQQDNDDD